MSVKVVQNEIIHFTPLFKDILGTFYTVFVFSRVCKKMPQGEKKFDCCFQVCFVNNLSWLIYILNCKFFLQYVYK